MIEAINPKINQKNNLKYLYNTRRYMIWAGFFGLLTAGVLIFSLLPQISSISELYNDMLNENKRLTQLRIKVAQLDQSANSVLLVNADKINQALPSRKPLIELLTGMGNIGRITNVNFTDISLNPGKISTDSATTPAPTTGRGRSSQVAVNRFDVLNLDVTVTGPIENINRFLREIENMAPFSNITAMSLNEKTNGDSTSIATPQFEAQITISTYFFPRVITANIDSALPELTPTQQNIITEIQNFTYSTAETQNQIQGGGLENLFPGVESIPTLNE